MIALPPLLAGAVKVMVAALLPGVPVPIVGAAGAPGSTMALNVTVTDADAGPVPTRKR